MVGARARHQQLGHVRGRGLSERRARVLLAVWSCPQSDQTGGCRLMEAADEFTG
jgi:hypothetical protein